MPDTRAADVARMVARAGKVVDPLDTASGYGVSLWLDRVTWRDAFVAALDGRMREALVTTLASLPPEQLARIMAANAPAAPKED